MVPDVVAKTKKFYSWLKLNMASVAVSNLIKHDFHLQVVLLWICDGYCSYTLKCTVIQDSSGYAAVFLCRGYCATKLYFPFKNLWLLASESCCAVKIVNSPHAFQVLKQREDLSTHHCGAWRQAISKSPTFGIVGAVFTKLDKNLQKPITCADKHIELFQKQK